jgi:predicted permease
MKTIWHDVRYGLRRLRKSPGFTVVAVLTLALAIGANTAIFSLINGLLLKSLPGVKDPQQLVLVTDKGRTSLSYPFYEHLRDNNQSFSGLFANCGVKERRMRLSGLDATEVEWVSAQAVSGNFFSVLGVPAVLGRTLTSNDDRSGDPQPVAVISHDFWVRRFGQDPAVVGKVITLEDVPLTIVGVTPREFFGFVVGERPDIWWPIRLVPQVVGLDDILALEISQRVRIAGRLEPGVAERQASEELNVIFRQMRLAQMEGRSLSDKERQDRLNHQIELQSAAAGYSWLRRVLPRLLSILMATVALVLLIACTNLAGLLLARGAARQHELAVRAAMGAGRWRLIKQSLTESMILSLAGVCLGLLLSVWIRAAVSSFVFDPLSGRQFDLTMDANVLMFALVVGVVATLLSGLLAALRAGKTDPLAGLKESSSRGAPRLRLGKVLVTAQVSMSVVFVVLAGLFSRTLINLYRVDPGFDMENLLLAPIDSGKCLSPPRDEQRFFDTVRQRIAAIPGVRSVALSATTLTGGLGLSCDIKIPGRPDDRERDALMLSVSDRYFATVGISLLKGRDFLPMDTAGSRRVVIVNEKFVRVFFPNENPLGQFIAIKDWEGEEYQIVGVCGDQMCRHLRRGTMPIFYIPHTEIVIPTMICVVRCVLPPLSLVPAVRKAVAEIDGGLPLEGITTQRLALKESLRLERLFTTLFGSFALLALTLSCIGLYGLMAYNLARRTNEMGIRKALGARPCDVARPILRQALLLTATGIAIGLPVALALVGLVRVFIYGIEPHDPLTVLATIVIMVTVAALAAWIPARRAARVDPMTALRYE